MVIGKVLLTRPEEQSQHLKNLLENDGFLCFVQPLFEIKKLLATNTPANNSAKSAIITSANACFALSAAKLSPETKIFTVGKITAQKLREDGFKNIVISPENSAKSLANLIANESGEILYFRGSKISFDFAKTFPNVREILAYETKAIENFSSNFLSITKEHRLDYILIFSQNSAEIFFKLASKHNLLEYFLSSQILCLSNPIAEKCRQLGFKKITNFSAIPILKNFYDRRI